MKRFLPDRGLDTLEAFDTRCKKFIDEGNLSDPLEFSDEIEGAIIVELIKHLEGGEPPSTFIMKDTNGKIIATPKTIDFLKKKNSPHLMKSAGYLNAAFEVCEAMMMKKIVLLMSRMRYDDAVKFLASTFYEGQKALDLYKEHFKEMLGIIRKEDTN